MLRLRKGMLALVLALMLATPGALVAGTHTNGYAVLPHANCNPALPPTSNC